MFKKGDRVLCLGSPATVFQENDGSDPYMCNYEIGIRYDDCSYEHGEYSYAIIDETTHLLTKPKWRL